MLEMTKEIQERNVSWMSLDSSHNVRRRNLCQWCHHWEPEEQSLPPSRLSRGCEGLTAEPGTLCE
jgi:hypothetical protein